MGDRFFGGSSYSNRYADDYNEEEEETEGEYEEEEVNDMDNGEKSKVSRIMMSSDCAVTLMPTIVLRLNQGSKILLVRKELQERHLRRIKESSLVDSSSKAAADSMLLSFVNSPQPAYRPRTIESLPQPRQAHQGKVQVLILWREYNQLCRLREEMRWLGVNLYKN